ncbi:MAG: HAMP domain-containing sensor histidine kinase [Bacteroidales bacterium]
MPESSILTILAEWEDEINVTLTKNNSIGIALFTVDGEFLFANDFIKKLFKEKAKENFINPTFNELISLENSSPLVFEGYMTLGDYSSVNTSIWAQVYRKANKLLIMGGVDAEQCLEQNKKLHQLNHEILDLQRELIRERNTLENTLEQLNTANEELKELNATKDKFFSIIGHDLRNPFNSLIGLSELLITKAEKYSPEKIKYFAQQMYDSSKSAFNLLENLLEWSRIQRGELEPDFEKVTPSEIIDEVKKASEQFANSKGINLQTKVNSNDYISADKEMLKTVLRNLVSNAIKFTYSGGVVKILTESIENYVQFTISDTGMGIPPEYVSKLFEIDCSLSKEGTENEKSTGLGLILCKEFIEKQGGKIWAESELEKGSNFKFTIPLWMNEETG